MTTNGKTREERLAAALRENLRRRKARARKVVEDRDEARDNQLDQP